MKLSELAFVLGALVLLPSRGSSWVLYRIPAGVGLWDGGNVIPTYKNIVDRFAKYLAATRGIPDETARDIARIAVSYAIQECDRKQSADEWYKWQMTGWQAPEKQLAELNPPVLDV